MPGRAVLRVLGLQQNGCVAYMGPIQLVLVVPVVVLDYLMLDERGKFFLLFEQFRNEYVVAECQGGLISYEIG